MMNAATCNQQTCHPDFFFFSFLVWTYYWLLILLSIYYDNKILNSVNFTIYQSICMNVPIKRTFSQNFPTSPPPRPFHHPKFHLCALQLSRVLTKLSLLHAHPCTYIQSPCAHKIGKTWMGSHLFFERCEKKVGIRAWI